MPPKRTPAQPEERHSKQTRSTRANFATKKTTGGATKQAGTKSVPLKPKTKSRAATANPVDTTPATSRAAASKSTSMNAPDASETPEDKSASEEADDIAAPSTFPSYQPQVIVKGNNILLKGAWTVRKYSNDFENDKERLELDRLKADVMKCAAISFATTTENEKQLPDSNEGDFQESDGNADLAHDDDSDVEVRRETREESTKGKRPVFRVKRTVDRTERSVVKHKDHGGGIFDPSVEIPPPMVRDPTYQYGQHHDSFQKSDGTVLEGWLVPQSGIAGTWHFKCFGTGDSDNIVACELMGSKGYFDPDTDSPTVLDVQAYRDYLRKYENIRPKIHDPTEPINIVWIPYHTNSNPHGLKDGHDNQSYSSDGSEDYIDADVDRGAGGVVGEQDTSGIGFSFPEATKAAHTTRSLDATVPGHEQTKKRKSLTATAQRHNETSIDHAGEHRPPKRARRCDDGECCGIAGEQGFNEKSSLRRRTADGAMPGAKSVDDTQPAPSARKKSLADPASTGAGHPAVDTSGNSTNPSAENP
ncbi:hypothetical protein DOTSEDRAFT_50123 [Dothistroma septosporum NZE10]|uniref:Uncharacterized protein n=1 Tax=Dothistroma septosporum (strain NZE10 / CBS 128990) TaxID=675120 RepID=N1Q2P6_DOTSN|nr:hypothetical protein DOTSEDRAFT_50123 [Dothistroma septosporum NZE10]